MQTWQNGAFSWTGGSSELFGLLSSMSGSEQGFEFSIFFVFLNDCPHLEPLDLWRPNLVRWWVVTDRSVVWKVWIAVFRNKVTLRLWAFVQIVYFISTDLSVSRCDRLMYNCWTECPTQCLGCCLKVKVTTRFKSLKGYLCLRLLWPNLVGRFVEIIQNVTWNVGLWKQQFHWSKPQGGFNHLCLCLTFYKHFAVTLFFLVHFCQSANTRGCLAMQGNKPSGITLFFSCASSNVPRPSTLGLNCKVKRRVNHWFVQVFMTVYAFRTIDSFGHLLSYWNICSCAYM